MREALKGISPDKPDFNILLEDNDLLDNQQSNDSYTYGSKSSSVSNNSTSNNSTVDNLNSSNSDGVSQESLEEEIQKLKEENAGFLSQRLREPTVSIDSYRLGGKMTYYYQNISQFALTFSGITDPANFPLMPGDIIDLRDYFETEEEILKNLELKKYEKPLIGSPYLRRLTPAQYAEKLRIKKELMNKKREEEKLRSTIGMSKNSTQSEKVSSVVESNVRQILAYFNTPAEERIKLTYTPTHFQSWLMGAIFTEAEYNWMIMNIKDHETQRKILERKQELEVLASEYAAANRGI